jgi:hypothetical protein
MINAKKTKSLSKNVFTITLLGLLTTTLNVAHAMNKPIAQESTRVDTIALEVENLKTIDELSEALDQTLQTITSYKTTIKQLRRGMFFDNDQKETEKAIEATEDLIREQERKASLIRIKLSGLKT